LTIALVLLVFGSAVYGFGHVKQSFFPNSTRPQIMVDYWLPQGSSIEQSDAHAARVEEYLLGLEGVKHVGSVIGQGAPRFLLTYTPEKANSAYTQFLVELDDATYIPTLYDEIQDYLDENFEEAQGQVRKFILGPGDPGKIQAKFFGPGVTSRPRPRQSSRGIMMPMAYATTGVGASSWCDLSSTNNRPVSSTFHARRSATCCCRRSKADQSDCTARATKCCRSSCVRHR
jgi:hypothetical protein